MLLQSGFSRHPGKEESGVHTMSAGANEKLVTTHLHLHNSQNATGKVIPAYDDSLNNNGCQSCTDIFQEWGPNLILLNT